MAFVNERIPEEEKEKFNFEVSTRPDGSKPTLFMWTIDRERNAYLVITSIKGGGADWGTKTTYFALMWNSHVVRFSGIDKRSRDDTGNFILNWQIESLEIPSPISEQKEEIIVLVRDALDVMGILYSRKGVDRVVVDVE